MTRSATATVYTSSGTYIGTKTLQAGEDYYSSNGSVRYHIEDAGGATYSTDNKVCLVST